MYEIKRFGESVIREDMYTEMDVHIYSVMESAYRFVAYNGECL